MGSCANLLAVGSCVGSVFRMETHEFKINAIHQRARADNLTICYLKKQIDVSFSCVCPVIDKIYAMVDVQ